MKKPILIARSDEFEQLRDCLESDRSEFVTVCGRRRVGKTFLVDQFFQGKYDFSFVGGHKLTTRQQLKNFTKAFKLYSGQKVSTPKNWFDAFDLLEEYLSSLPEDRKKIIFIDEMPWIDTQRSDFVDALENFWNGWANRRYDIVFIASGSATSWMADNLHENQGGLHNRITTRLYLKPFTLKETEEYLRQRNFKWDRYQILECYMFTGGVPFYLSLLKPRYSIAQNIDKLFFNEKGALRSEFNELYGALFENAEKYIKIVQLLYETRKGLTRKEISKKMKFNGSLLTTMLQNLEQCSFINKRGIFGNNEEVVYRLVDHYTLFYYHFFNHTYEGNEDWWCNNLDDSGVLNWMGHAFELICLQHHRQIKKALEIGGMATSVYTWQCQPDKQEGTPGAQIDLIIERADRMLHLCEMKFSREEYELSSDYEKKLRKRAAIFKKRTDTKYSILHTFVTTYGVLEGKNKSIVHSEVTMDDLFNS